MTAARVRRLAGGVLAAGAAASIVCGAISPALAAEPEGVLVSTDGVTFTPTLNTGLFDDLGRIIPGGSMSASIWIKNDSDSAAAMRVSTRDLRYSSEAFADALHLAARSSPAAVRPSSLTASRPLATFTECEVLVSTPRLAAGAVTQLTLTFDFHDVTGTTAQGDTASVNLLVAMRDATAPPFSASACADTGTLLPSTAADFDRLPGTGVNGVAPLLIGGGVLFAAGAAVLALAGLRRDRRIAASHEAP